MPAPTPGQCGVGACHLVQTERPPARGYRRRPLKQRRRAPARKTRACGSTVARDRGEDRERVVSWRKLRTQFADKVDGAGSDNQASRWGEFLCAFKCVVRVITCFECRCGHCSRSGKLFQACGARRIHWRKQDMVEQWEENLRDFLNGLIAKAAEDECFWPAV